MRPYLRIALATAAMAVLLQTQTAHAQGLCIPILTCPSQSSGSNNAPEISGESFTTGMALVAGAAVMIRRRRHSKSVK